MKLRLIFAGLVAGIFPVRLTPVDVTVKPGEIVKKDAKTGLFKGSIEIELVETDVVQTVGFVTDYADPTRTILVTNDGRQLVLSEAAMKQLTGAAVKRNEVLRT